MQIFLSWSGERSKAVAETLRNWLPKVLGGISTWASSQDIDAGSLWLLEISQKLRDTGFGIICMTQENISAPWMYCKRQSNRIYV